MGELESKNRDELEAMAKECGIAGYTTLKKPDLVYRILQAEAQQQGNTFITGVLETISEGYGFLRQDTFRRGANDVYVSNSQIRRFNLRDGDSVCGQARPPKEGEKYYSLLRFDEPVEVQTRVAELALERAKRLVEMGKDVVILLDGITRLTRAYNLALPPSGRTLSGGIDSTALHPPKRFFGTARNIEEGGSLTIIATCLVDTGSRMDDLIYEEFKGTGNMELHLDRKLSERRIFPAIDIMPSGTRREELLLDENTLKQVWLLRRVINMIDSDSPNHGEATQRILERLGKTKNNAEFLATLSKDM
jgi:transcription termination factor Rho